ncbi:MAG: phosphatase PAP2 family protein [Terriglobia bacterium]
MAKRAVNRPGCPLRPPTFRSYQDEPESPGGNNGFATPPQRPISFVRLLPNVLQDQKRIWFSPRLILQGSHWKVAVIFVVITGGLLMLDPHDPGYFRHTREFHEFNAIVSGQNAADAMWVVMLSALGIGLVRQDDYLKTTFLYGVEAVLDSEILTQVLKGLDRRLRPQDVMSYHHIWDSWFRDRGTWYAGPGSFPSGHMIAAISIATVFAVRYRKQRWVPWLAYTLALVVGFSRITLLSHFPSDVFAGAFFGYLITRYVVLGETGTEALDAQVNERQETPDLQTLR